MEHYVTIFDRLFLPQGLALHQSMVRHAGPFTLWVVCVDDETADVLERLQLPHARPLRLSTLENERLRRVKPSRSAGEYCWTLTPFSFKFVMAADPMVARVTYVDADLWLRRFPSPVFDELARSGKHVLITDHAYAPEHDQSEDSGQFCVQFLTFTRHPDAETVRQWWEDRCIEWCFARHEDGKFGDQKYLDMWPVLFGDHVHTLQDKERFLAPWNATRFPRGNAVAYHFHSLRLLANRQVLMVGNYELPSGVVEHIYRPYLADLSRALTMLADIGFTAAPQKATPVVRKRSGLSQLWRQIRDKPAAIDHTLIESLP
jgi:hypothetical protein